MPRSQRSTPSRERATTASARALTRAMSTRDRALDDDAVVARAARQVRGVGAGDHRLRGRAPGVDARPAEQRPLDERHLHARAGEPPRERRPRLPRADDDGVERRHDTQCSDLNAARISRDEELRLLPGREVTALVELVVVDELGIRLLRPAPRGLIELVGKGAHGDRDGDALRREEGELALPVEARRRDRRVRQPVERDVVEDVVARQALGLPVEDARDERVAARVVVEHPGGQADRRIRDRVQRLRAVRHLAGVAQAVLVEEVELVVRVLLVGREAGRRPARRLRAPSSMSAGTVAGMLV